MLVGNTGGVFFLPQDSTLCFFATRMMFAPYDDILTLDLSDGITSQYGWGFQKVTKHPSSPPH